MIRFKVNPLWCSYDQSSGGEQSSAGSDSGGGRGGGGGAGGAERAGRDMGGRSMNDMSAAEMAGRAGGSWGSDYGTDMDMTNLKGMLTSPSAQAYNDYYSSKLGVMGTPGASWGDFGKALTDIGSYWGNTAAWGLQDMLSSVTNLPDTVMNALGLGKKQSAATDMTANSPMPGVDPAALGMALGNIAQTRLPTDDEINMVAGVMANKGLLGNVDLAGMKLANVAGQAVSTAVNPLAGTMAMKAGLDLTNPVTQKAMGMGIDQLGNFVSRAINSQTIAERASGTGIGAGKAGTTSSAAGEMSEAAGRGGSERPPDLGGEGKINAFNAFLNQGGFQNTTSKGQQSASGSGNVNTQDKAPAPMAKRQKGSRLGLSDYMTLTNNLGAGQESVELRNRMLGGA